MTDYTPAARQYWWVVTALGWAALVMSIAGLAHATSSVAMIVVAGVLLSAIAGLVPVTIPGTRTSVSMAEIFVFLLLLMAGPDAAVIAAAAEAGCISFRTSKRWTSRLGSPAMAAIAMWVASHVFVWLLVLLSPEGNNALMTKIVLLFVVAAVYFSLGTVLPVSLIKLKKGETIQPLGIIGQHAWMGFASMFGAAIAGLLHASFGTNHGPIAIVAVLLTLSLMAMLHLYHRHTAPRLS